MPIYFSVLYFRIQRSNECIGFVACQKNTLIKLGQVKKMKISKYFSSFELHVYTVYYQKIYFFFIEVPMRALHWV